MFLDHPIISSRYFFERPDPPPEIFYVTSDKIRLACWYMAPHPAAKTVVFFHGNGEVVNDYIPWFTNELLSRGLNVFLAEYRGYGASTGSACMAGMLDDIKPIFEAIGEPQEKIIVFGRSVGSIYAIEFAARYPSISGLVLESGIADVLERILLRVQPEEVGATHEDLQREVDSVLNHEQKLLAYQNPLLVLHAQHDSLVPVHHGERLANWGSSKNKTLIRFPHGDHNSVMIDNWKAYWEAFEKFIR